MNPNEKKRVKADPFDGSKAKQSSPQKKTRKVNPFWQQRKKEKQIEDDKFEEVKANPIQNLRPNDDDGSSRLVEKVCPSS